MALNEVFPKPTVKQVVFEIRYPNLFFLENKIGELQLGIMEKFPESALYFRRQLLLADLAPKAKIEDVIDKDKMEQMEQSGAKEWQFTSPSGYQLSVLMNSLNINSQLHKTYKNKSSDNRFRDIIEFVVSRFLKITNLPLIMRIGLRYIDECPVPSNKTDEFLNYYNSTFPVSRFKIDDSIALNFSGTVRRGNCFLRYIESFTELPNNTYKLTLDFDGYANNVPAENYLKIADALHDLISAEYEATIKEPVLQYMRGK